MHVSQRNQLQPSGQQGRLVVLLRGAVPDHDDHDCTRSHDHHHACHNRGTFDSNDAGWRR